MRLGSVFRLHRDGDDLIGKGPAIGCRRCALVALHGVGIQRVPAQVPLFGNHLSAGELRENYLRILLGNTGAGRAARLRTRRPAPGGPHRHPAHRFRTCRNHYILHTRHNGLRGKMDRLLGRPALPVNRHCRHAFRQARGHHRIAPEMHPLLTHLADTAHDHVIHRVRRHASARHHVIQHDRGQIDRVPATYAAITSASGGAGCGNNISLRHFLSSGFRPARSGAP